MKIEFLNTAVFAHGLAPSEEPAALRTVELCGRTAYKSEDKITPDSAKAFVLMLKKHGHLSVLEHSNIVLKIGEKGRGSKAGFPEPVPQFAEKLQQQLAERNAYHKFYAFADSDPGHFAVSGNLRAWLETLAGLQSKESALQAFFAHHLHRFYPNLFPAAAPPVKGLDYPVALLGEAEQLAILNRDAASDLPRFVFKIVCDRGITHEIVRHRVFSFTQESTRYVNYGNRGLSLILPEELVPFYNVETGELQAGEPLVQRWLTRATKLFEWYQEDLHRGRRPEIARDILPNLLKSEIFVTGSWSGWRHFITLRDSKQAHPRIRFIARQVRNYFDSIGIHCA